ncbi:MAG TPA: hypothetical protein VLH75_01915, partial [Longimicrobiales bacterium]|nr:hypothetical protein [Longimicrobiales bacterium]
MSRHTHPTRAPGALALVLAATACAPAEAPKPEVSPMQAKVDEYATVPLTADLSHLSDNDRQVVRLLIEAVAPMDEVFWMQTYGDGAAALALAGDDAA